MLPSAVKQQNFSINAAIAPIFIDEQIWSDFDYFAWFHAYAIQCFGIAGDMQCSYVPYSWCVPVRTQTHSYSHTPFLIV